MRGLATTKEKLDKNQMYLTFYITYASYPSHLYRPISLSYITYISILPNVSQLHIISGLAGFPVAACLSCLMYPSCISFLVWPDFPLPPACLMDPSFGICVGWLVNPKSNQIKSNQIKSNQIKSSQIKSNQIEAGHRLSRQYNICCNGKIFGIALG